MQSVEAHPLRGASRPSQVRRQFCKQSQVSVVRPGSDSLLWRAVEASWLEWVALFAITAGLLWLASWVKGRFQENDDHEALSHQMLTQFGELYRQGDLSKEEFRLIKSRLVERFDKTTVGLPARDASEGSPAGPANGSAEHVAEPPDRVRSPGEAAAEDNGPIAGKQTGRAEDA